MGVKPGWPDLVLPVPARGFSGLALEFKTTEGRLSKEQKAWAKHFMGNGWEFVVVRSALEAREAILQYFDLMQQQLPPMLDR